MRLVLLVSLVFCGIVAGPASALAQHSEEHAREAIHVETPGEYRPQSTPDLKQAAQEIIRRTNRFREKKQLQPVDASPSLMKAAQYFADFMAQHDLYGHTADDQRPADRARKFDYEICLIAENIAYRFETRGFTTKELAKDFVRGWKQSPEHRKNMLRPGTQQTGVAVAKSEQTGVFYGVQMFGRPRSASIRFSVKNGSELTVSYKLGKREFELPPHYRREHEMCREAELTFSAHEGVEPAKADETFQPSDGDSYQIEPAGEDRCRVVRSDQQGTAASKTTN